MPPTQRGWKKSNFAEEVCPISRPVVCLWDAMLDPAAEELVASETEIHRIPLDASESKAMEELKEAEGLIVKYPARVTRNILASAPRLRIVCASGTGVDHIDIQAATENGIVVTHNPLLGANAVAEAVLCMMLALAGRLPEVNQRMHKEGFACRPDFMKIQAMKTELAGKTVGILGLGAIGRRVAELCRAFNMRIVAFDPFVSDDIFRSVGAERYTDLDAFYREVDFLTVHTPGGQNTDKLVGAKELALMKPSAYLINCARGNVVDKDALAEALRAKRLAGAGVDVFDPEPPPENYPLFGLENVILTPHIAGVTRETVRALALNTAQQLIRFFKGERPAYMVNPGVWERRKAFS